MNAREAIKVLQDYSYVSQNANGLARVNLTSLNVLIALLENEEIAGIVEQAMIDEKLIDKAEYHAHHMDVK